MRTAPRPDAATIACHVLAWVLPVAAFANAAAYIAYAGNPLVSSDAWYFVDAFLREALSEGPDFRDFFVKRGPMDHAQPLLKLLLWFNATWLGLDFVFEALMGLFFACATFVLLAWTSRDALQRQPWWLRVLLPGALAAALVTLNSGMVYDWSLVTLGFLSYFLALVSALVAWRAIHDGGFARLFLAALALGFLLDGVGMLIGVALGATAALAGWKVARSREGWMAAGTIAVALAGSRLLSSLLLDPHPDAAAGTAANVEYLLGLGGEWIEMARIVLGSTIAHINQVARHFPDDAVAWQGRLAWVAALAHAWFWWRAWTGSWNRPVFNAVALMLLFYGMVAGILLTRVPLYGVNYLHEPRYGAIYLLGNVSIVLMLIGQPLRSARAWSRALAGVVLAAVVALQVPLSSYTWHEGSYLHLYYHRMARNILELGENPAVVPEDCLPLVSVCAMAPEDRVAIMALLKRHELNVYSPAFAERYGLSNLVEHYTGDAPSR